MGDRSRIALVLGLLLSCSSGGSTAPDGSTGVGPDVAAVVPADAASAADSTPGAVDSAPGAVDSAPGATADVQASEECVKFCTCMAKNCADKMFPGGCLPACAAQTRWDLPCRQNMCGLVPAQPNNDHCTHAFGVVQCLDKP